MSAPPKILILNGPNLNMLGRREPEIYGHQTLGDIHELCLAEARKCGFDIDFRQSNHEGELVAWIQESLGKVDAIVINAAAYTHTSVAIHDALKLHAAPVVEVHLSNPKEREDFRHLSYIEPLASAVFAGLGAASYVKALDYLSTVLVPKTP
jgi:3-dehydroquinate dehydratase-2